MIRVSKIEHHNSDVACGILNEWKHGEENGNLSLPVEYWIEGEWMAPPSVGSCMMIDRRIRNGTHTPGMFKSSPITEILHISETVQFVRTNNSLYKVENI